MPPRVMLKHPNPCHHTDTHTSFDPAKSEVDLRASHGLSLRLFRGGRALHSAVRGRAVRMGHEQDENSTLSSKESITRLVHDLDQSTPLKGQEFDVNIVGNRSIKAEGCCEK